MQTMMLATGVECSYPVIRDGHRRDQIEETGHYQYWREDLELARCVGYSLSALRHSLPPCQSCARSIRLVVHRRGFRRNAATRNRTDPKNLERGLVVPEAVYIEDDQVIIILSNEGKLITPVTLHPWLATASAEQQADYEMSGFSFDWPALDEGLDIGWIQSYQNSQLGRADSK